MEAAIKCCGGMRCSAVGIIRWVRLTIYTYAAGNPINNFDPTGRDAWTYYIDYINLVNFISNVNADVFGFVSAEGSVPTGSPVRAAGGLTGLVGYETQDGAYVAGIPAVGTLYGGSDLYYGNLAGVEFGLRCGGPTQQSIDMQDVSLDLGAGIGVGRYTAGFETGYFGYFGLGAFGDEVVVGVGVGGGPQSQNYIQPWGGAW